MYSRMIDGLRNLFKTARATALRQRVLITTILGILLRRAKGAAPKILLSNTYAYRSKSSCFQL